MTDYSTPRQVANTNLKVPPLGYGAAWVATPSIPVADVQSTVRTAFESGVRLFDTAPWYGIGRSERRLGIALADLGVERDEYAVNTKVGRTLQPEPTEDANNETQASDGTARTPRDPQSQYRVHFNYSYEAIRQQHRDSLQRLGTSRVNSLTLHDIDYGYQSNDQLEKILEQLNINYGGGGHALAELKHRRDIDAIGMGCNLETRNAFSWEDSSHEDLVEQVVNMVDIDFLIMAGCYTLLETRALRRLLPLCESRGMSVIIASPFAGGWLVNPSKAGYMYSRMSRREVPDEIKTLTQNIQNTCDSFNVPIGAVALQFVLAHPAVAAAIPGSASVAEATANREFLNIDIPSELWHRLKEQELIALDAPCPGDT